MCVVVCCDFVCVCMFVCVRWDVQFKFLHLCAQGTPKIPHNMIESCRTHGLVVSHVWMSHVTHIKGSCHMYEGGTSHTESMGLQRNGTG